ncbi:GNAT family N-acetyltransferase [Catellatospora bangladeshensis]|uniref:Acetyltransferase n=1 Tax=Catellatospora bangladeshensis TaxID=310355 RepID=A0A8J3JA65_9ACTN|nr:GNAT family N-acetyltransferase [Catellatospora bangladeshensis]GIF79004.1 acetyltransferase [Catellatospora bangladeshensis]
MRLVPWTPDDLARRMDDVLSVFGEAMSYQPPALAVRRGYISTHLQRPHFRAIATVSTAGHLLGFAYGYHSEPGQWWHDQVSAVLDGPARQRWLADCFEVVELHVRPSAQGHGLGEAQLRALLAMTPAATTLLSTPEADEQASRAWRLYRRTGFEDVSRHLLFPGDPRPFAVLGRSLPLPFPQP